jgi:hypothetical protein
MKTILQKLNESLNNLDWESIRELIGDYFEVRSVDSDRYFEQWSTIDEYYVSSYNDMPEIFKRLKLKRTDYVVDGLLDDDLHIFVAGHEDNTFSIYILLNEKELVCQIDDVLNKKVQVSKLCDLLDNFDSFDDDVYELVEKLKNI